MLLWPVQNRHHAYFSIARGTVEEMIEGISHVGLQAWTILFIPLKRFWPLHG
jgi:hypothetical protein